MGPTKVVIKQDTLYDAKSGKQIMTGLSTPQQIHDYAAHHYIALPIVDKAGPGRSIENRSIVCMGQPMKRWMITACIGPAVRIVAGCLFGWMSRRWNRIVSAVPNAGTSLTPD